MQRAEANWIWRDRGVPFPFFSLISRIDPALDANLFVQFRRSFHIEALPAAVRAAPHLRRRPRYRLYVSGVRFGRGRSALTAFTSTYDEYDIAPFLA